MRRGKKEDFIRTLDRGVGGAGGESAHPAESAAGVTCNDAREAASVCDSLLISL